LTESAQQKRQLGRQRLCGHVPPSPRGRCVRGLDFQGCAERNGRTCSVKDCIERRRKVLLPRNFTLRSAYYLWPCARAEHHLRAAERKWRRMAIAQSRGGSSRESGATPAFVVRFFVLVAIFFLVGSVTAQTVHFTELYPFNGKC